MGKIRKIRDGTTQDMAYVCSDGRQYYNRQNALDHQRLINKKNRGVTKMGAAQAKPKTEIKVKAYGVEHARRIASGLTGYPMTSIVDTVMSKKPRQAKTCSTDDFPVKGTRKWVTVYNVYAYGNKVPVGRNKYEYTNMEFVKGGFSTKADALAEARKMAVKHQLPMTVQIAKELEKDSPTVSDVEPKTSVGEYTVSFLV
jgi:hypothetical protein